ncbi:glycerate kinase [Kribbella shirazensis]|uniref:Glycerate kinase n=1 Tax=Kribbella shirazensis TaxID=1105143 RepID=A0A7X5V735_9ACTN|nr:glycerate kinase [Kribbella shirazensis]NIK55147.1 glycerate kinase [Kribbella shirazensis]
MGTASYEGFGLRVVVASDKFKGTVTSTEVAEAVGAGVRRVCPDATVTAVPVADGGDGTLAAAVAAGYTLVPVVASGPTGEPVSSGYARRGNTAVVELADVSGLVRLPDGIPAPLTATSYGTGQLLAAALDAGCTRIVLAIGGSASTDGGRGLIDALSGNNSALCDEKLPESGLADLRRRMRGVQVVVACDVDNPLTGPRGAAAVYGPQKGADAHQVAELDARLSRWADVVAKETGRDLRDTPGAGAAGGVGFAALALLDAELRPGIDLVLDLVGFRHQLDGADLVITGEGALDEQTLHGKAVAGVAAATTGIPVVAVCGVNRLEPEQLREIGVTAAYALTDVEPDVRRCMAEPRPLLEELGERIAVDHLTMTRRREGTA